jgi:hypothetical protein
MKQTKKMEKKKQIKKSDIKLIIIALYTICHQKEKEVQKYTKQLEEYLAEKYNLKDEKTWDFSSIVCDSIYGSEDDFPEFFKLLNEHAALKK